MISTREIAEMKTSSPFRSAAAMTTLAMDESSSDPERYLGVDI
jgi:hypothetical protein